ncbi:UDP-4-amino-4,6-dideoxy-N-acetyl-beta-L-altrosamine N-acetyltransferase [Microbulbifer agarilyticus]|uniref:UDP-4-amino-4, 6-dideoxy-N-acetyl-beta-L-altrosamine N-acetyltransferase n=2 Tax=Microbulbifer agarilyticus TaxID=260552 RepID=A0A1Q2M9S4_9GAMM|nr:UDP-4-amino-4,6-dideoxy-N-acetyl-beta-L-altrosamine N-acetyltransferase [Microbulbifer agarilyticus]
MKRDDLRMVLQWRNHIEVRRFMYSQEEISFLDHTKWFEANSNNPDKKLLIFEKNDISLGFINFDRIRNSDVVDWGFYTAPNAPKGTGKRLGKTVLDYAFKGLNFRKVCGQVLSYNQRSINFHLKLGFRQEGVLVDQYFDGHKYHSVVCFGLLSNEWNMIQCGEESD